MNRNMKKAHRTNRLAKIQAIFNTVLICLGTFLCTGMTAFADGENPNPTGLGGTATFNTLVTVVFWIIRILVLIPGGVALVKLVNSFSDENPRDRNNALITIVASAAAFAVTFIIENFI